MARLRGPAPGDRGARRLPARLARPGRPRRGARPRRSRSPRQIGGLGVPVFLYGELAREPGPRRARLLPQRRPGRALAADGGGRAAARLRPAAAAPDAPARPWSPPGRRSPPSTSSSTAPTSRSPARSPPGCARRAAACPGCGRSACRSPSGRAQVSTNVHDPLAVPLAQVVERVRGWRRRSARGRSRPSWSGWSRRRRSSAIPDDVPIRGFDPRAARDRATRLAALEPILDSAMAQTKKKRRRKHRGTQGGRIDTSRRRGRPRSRAEAKARARSRRASSSAPARRPTCRRPGAAPRSAASSPRSSSPCPAADLQTAGRRRRSTLGAFMLVFYIPTGYYIDMTMWRRTRAGADPRRREPSSERSTSRC